MKMFVMILMLSVSLQVAFADETVTEKASAGGNRVGRAVKKGANKLQEAACLKSDAKCAAEKLGNRTLEAKDGVVDGAKEAGNKID